MYKRFCLSYWFIFCLQPVCDGIYILTSNYLMKYNSQVIFEVFYGDPVPLILKFRYNKTLHIFQIILFNPN